MDPSQMPPLPPPSDDDRGPAVRACAIVMVIMSTIAVAIRFGSRLVLKSYPFWWDDWAVLATLIFSHGFLSCAMYWTTIGLGKHYWMIPIELAQANNLTNRATLCLYATTIWLIKLSALLLYSRLFKISRRFVRALWITGFIITSWWVITVIVPWSFCTPWKKNIDLTVPGECISPAAWHHSLAFINFFLDFVVLLLPMPVVWHLQMTFKKKVGATIVFLIGYSSAFLSLSRFILIEIDPSILNAGPTEDMSWKLVPIMFPSLLEGPIAIVALCGPSINRLIAHAAKNGSLTSLFTSRRSKTGASGSGYSGKSLDSKRTPSSKISDLSSSGAPLDGYANSTTAINRESEDWHGPEQIQMRPVGRNGDRYGDV